MAEINADIDDVINALTSENARLGRENAILLARLKSANAMIDGLQAAAVPAPPAPLEGEVLDAPPDSRG